MGVVAPDGVANMVQRTGDFRSQWQSIPGGTKQFLLLRPNTTI